MFIVGTNTPISAACSCVSFNVAFAEDTTLAGTEDTTLAGTEDTTLAGTEDLVVSGTEDTTLAGSPHKLILISNNPQWLQIPSLGNYLSVQYMETQALDVLTTARDRIHTGWHLLNHPLYGNFRPYQQPFRSILAQSSKNCPTDTLSLHLIEQALSIYHDCAHQILDLAELHPNLLHDCAFLDRALLDATLEHCCHCSFLNLTSYKE